MLTPMVRRGTWAAALLVALLGACANGSSDGLTLSALEADAILDQTIAGTTNPRTTDTQSGERPSLTVLMDVTGDWNAVSGELAEAARATGWTITSVNCVGTGNDVIAKKQIDGTWALLESGAGTRGAGIIIRYDPDQRSPGAFSVSGRCPTLLVAAAEP
jgi:hypothetical protein